MKAIIYKIQLEHWIFGILFFAGSYFSMTIDYDNSASRFYLVSAMVDYGVLHIDPYAELTGDKSFHHGHFYSNKAIGAPLLAAPVYWLDRRASGSHKHPPLAPGSRYLIRLVTTTVPFAFLGVVLFGLARRWGAGPRSAFSATIAYGLGSIALIHASLFSGHGMAAAFAFFSFALLVSLRGERVTRADRSVFADQARRSGVGRSRSPGEVVFGGTRLSAAFLAGLTAGIAGLCDYTAMYTAVVLALFALATLRPVRLMVGFLSGGLLCALLLAAYNWHCFGSPLSFSYANQVAAEFAESSRQGLLGITWPSPQRLAALLFSPARGLLAIMPVFVFSFPGLWHMFRSRTRRPEAVVILAVVLGYLMINAGFYGWHGGWTYGPRYLVPMLPFLAVAMVFMPREPLAFVLCLLVSVLQITLALAGLPHAPDPIRNPLIELVIPCMREGYLAESWPAWMGIPRGVAILVYVMVLGLFIWGAWRKIVAGGEETGFDQGGGPADAHVEKQSGGGAPLKGRQPQSTDLRWTIGIRDWRLALPAGLWVLIIAVMLAVVRTSPPEIVTRYQERLLFHLRNEEVIYRYLHDLTEAYQARQMGQPNPSGLDKPQERSSLESEPGPADP